MAQNGFCIRALHECTLWVAIQLFVLGFFLWTHSLLKHHSQCLPRTHVANEYFANRICGQITSPKDRFMEESPCEGDAHGKPIDNRKQYALAFAKDALPWHTFEEATGRKHARLLEISSEVAGHLEALDVWYMPICPVPICPVPMCRSRLPRVHGYCPIHCERSKLTGCMCTGSDRMRARAYFAAFFALALLSTLLMVQVCNRNLYALECSSTAFLVLLRCRSI
jgi:hypothetical protein